MPNKRKLNSNMILYKFKNISQNGQYKDVHGGKREFLQRARIFKAECCLKILNHGGGRARDSGS